VLAAAGGLAAVGLSLAGRPSLDRHWAPDHARLATASFTDSVVRIDGVRDFEHCPTSGDAVERWVSRTCDVEALDSVWYVLSPFDRERRGPAHAFLTFGFGDTAFVAVSVEARRERDEDYSIWRGMANGYELIYVVAEERDVISLRVLCRDDDVFVYPLRVTPAKARLLFRNLLDAANGLADRPQFYHTLWNSCASNLRAHANAVAERRIPGGWRVALPGHSDEIVHSLGLVDGEGSIEEVRARFLVNERVRRHAGSPDLSARIRRDDPVARNANAPPPRG
jgi:hypothetical protein